MEKCCACGKEFVSQDLVITFYFQEVKRGEKSGALGFYEHRNSPDQSVDYVHFSYGCLEKCFSPIENPFMYDLIADSVRLTIWEEEKDQDLDIPLAALDDDPPYCLWCKRTDTVWLQRQPDLHIYNCVACSKLWDQEEDELLWNPHKNRYEYIMEVVEAAG